ncbi:MAG: hypothetical protein R2712_24650 [Vicinamibacterales bacterium]
MRARLDTAGTAGASRGYGRVEPFSRWLTGTQAVLAVKDRRAVIAFRGSESTLDWIVDVLCILVGLPPRHLGFAVAWWSARGRLMALPERHRDSFDVVELCGHPGWRRRQGRRHSNWPPPIRSTRSSRSARLARSGGGVPRA